MKEPMDKCRNRLALLWFIGGGIVFFTVLVQTFLGQYGDQSDQAWGWLLPTIMPTLSLIVSVLIVDALAAESKPKTISSFVYRLTFGLSAAYLLVVILTIYISTDHEKTLKLMGQSNIWLGPFQGLVVASLAVFFSKAE